MDELIKTLFISWCDSCAWPSRMWSSTPLLPPLCHHWWNIHTPPTISLCSHPIWSLEMFCKCWWMSMGAIFFPRGRTQWYTFASSALPCQTPFCQTAPLLPSATQEQCVMEDGCECSASTAIPPTSASGIVGQRNNIGGITFATVIILLTKDGVCWDFVFHLHQVVNTVTWKRRSRSNVT